jgi:hypothetical protein
MALAETKSRKLSRRKKARAKRTLETVLDTVVAGIGNDPFLRNHLFIKKTDSNHLSVGSYTIVRNDCNLFDVFDKQKQKIYSNLYVFDAAMALVEALNANRKTFLPIILEAEETYARNVNDMKLFKHMMSLKNENIDIYEDRYIMVRQRAEHALEQIKKFRLTKS